MWVLIVSTLFPADSGGAAEEAGSDRRLRLCRRAQGPEHLQQALLQANIHTGLRFSRRKPIYCIYFFLMKCGLFVFSYIFSRSAVKVDFLSISYRQLEKQVWKKLFWGGVCVAGCCCVWQSRLPPPPSGSWWCKRSDGAGVRNSGAGELQTDPDDGRDHLWALYLLENPQRLPGVSASQVGFRFLAVMTINSADSRPVNTSVWFPKQGR